MERIRRSPGEPALRIAGVCSQTSSSMSIARASRLAGESRYGSGCGSPAGRWNALRNGASASSVTTQGASVLAKFFDRKGPSGWYSQPWMSRALQSLNKAMPNT